MDVPQYSNCNKNFQLTHLCNWKLHFNTFSYNIDISHNLIVRSSYFQFFSYSYSTFINIHWSSRGKNYRLTELSLYDCFNPLWFALAPYMNCLAATICKYFSFWSIIDINVTMWRYQCDYTHVIILCWNEYVVNTTAAF
jgi:hypothetical protein